ncbi:MAG: DNA-3-methyladenine glycosylase 2 family protein [Acidobacteria bacterium]|nr:MAG: DNA-3-methyladenine glycosylase 2 family protein [Acidobacteriota bacterium]
MLIKPQQPFDFLRTLKFILSPPSLNNRSYEPLMDHFEDGEYRRVISIAGRPVLYGVREERNSNGTCLRIRVLKGPKDRSVQHQVRQAVSRQFAAGLDLTPFHKMARNDMVLRGLAERFRGMRIPQSPSVYECVVCAILEQQVNLTFAHQVKKALVETYGETVEFEGRSYSAFPEPHTLASTTSADLRKLQISGPKARYVIGISRTVANGKVDLEGLRSASSEEARARLMEHKGIGPWTADYVCLRALGKLDHLPSADVGLQKTVKIFYRLRKLPTSARVEQIGRKWEGWRSYATFYLWLTYWEQPEWKESLLAEIQPGNRILH